MDIKMRENIIEVLVRIGESYFSLEKNSLSCQTDVFYFSLKNNSYLIKCEGIIWGGGTMVLWVYSPEKPHRAKETWVRIWLNHVQKIASFEEKIWVLGENSYFSIFLIKKLRNRENLKYLKTFHHLFKMSTIINKLVCT